MTEGLGSKRVGRGTRGARGGWDPWTVAGKGGTSLTDIVTIYPPTPLRGGNVSKPIKLIALLKARPGISREDFAQRWIEQHAPLTLRFANLKGYRINIASSKYQEIEGELPFDGTAEMWWDSLEDMHADFASEEAQAAVADADTFTVVRTHIYTEEHVLL